jgi:hypothetical protein
MQRAELRARTRRPFRPCSGAGRGATGVGDITSIRTTAGWRHLAVFKMELDPDDNREALISSRRLQRDLAAWIEGYYNHERRHATISYLSPIDYEQQFIAAH